MANEQISKVSVPVTVVGLPQSLYKVDGEDDLVGLDTAIAYVEAGAVDAIEGLATDAAAVVRDRQKRVSELGRAMAEVAKAKAWLDCKEKAEEVYEGFLSYTYTLQNLRGYDFALKSPSVTKREIEEVSMRVQHESEIMGNHLSQVTSMLNDYVSKRDKIYGQMEKAMTKISMGTAKTIREMGG